MNEADKSGIRVFGVSVVVFGLLALGYWGVHWADRNLGHGRGLFEWTLLVFFTIMVGLPIGWYSLMHWLENRKNRPSK
jgi:hypothetical protein